MRTHTIKLCYHKSYTRKMVQGSLWKWVKVSSDVTHRRARQKGASEEDKVEQEDVKWR